MKKTILILTAIISLNFSAGTFALEKGIWTLTKDSDWCYIGSYPINSDLPETKKEAITIYLFIRS